MAEGSDDNSSQPWSAFAGKWQVERSENFEDFLKEMGAPWMIRKMASMSKGTIEITVAGDKLTIHVVSTFMSTVPNTFHINSGTETEATFNGKVVKAKTTWEDGKLIMILSPSEDGQVKGQKITRELVGEELVQTMEVGTVICRRFMKRC